MSPTEINSVLRIFLKVLDVRHYKVRKSGSTSAITIPENWIKFNAWLKKPQLTVTLGDGKIIISDPDLDLEELSK